MTEYKKIVDDHLEKLNRLQDERLRIDREIKQVRILIKAALNMLPDEDKGAYLVELGERGIQQVGLTMAIRTMLQGANGCWLTPVEIKDRLEYDGYDFSAYKSNPLSSIHSILKRFKPSEVKTMHFPEGMTGYVWIKKQGKKK